MPPHQFKIYGNKNPKYALLAAAINNDIETIRELLAVGTPTSAITKHDGNTALHYAVINKNCEMIRLLIENGANRAIANSQNHTAIELAADYDYWNVVNTFAEYMTDTDDKARYGSALLNAVIANETTTADRLLNAGAKMIWRTMPDEKGLLHHAVRNNNSDMVLLLLRYGFDINDTTAKKSTPLHIAVLRNKPVIVRLLLEKGADMNLVNNRHKTALQLAHQTYHHNCLTAFYDVNPSLAQSEIQETLHAKTNPSFNPSSMWIRLEDPVRVYSADGVEEKAPNKKMN